MASKKRKRAPRKPPRPPPFTLKVPGRKTELTQEVADTIAGHVLNFATITDAFQMAGVEYQTAEGWLRKGRLVNSDTPTHLTESEALYSYFASAVENAKAKRRQLIKAMIRKAAIGTDKRPGDWRAAQALGATSDPEHFVPQVRVFIQNELDAVLDRIKVRFANRPDVYAEVLEAVAAGDVEPQEENGDGHTHGSREEAPSVVQAPLPP